MSLIIIRHFLHSVRWSAVEVVGYHLLLAAHHTILFRTVTPAFYGIVGTTFSLVYLIAFIADMGLEASLSAFLSRWTLNAQEARHFLIKSFVPTCVVWILACTCLVLFKYIAGSDVGELIGYIIILSGIEALRRPLKTMHQLIFQGHIVALTEVAMLVTYLMCVWGWYFLHQSITPAVIFIPFIVLAGISCAVLAYAFYGYYTTLPQYDTPDHAESGATIIKQRFFNALAQVSILPFSSNFLVPLFAYQFGAVYAGMLKLASNLVHNGATIITKVLNTSSRVGFAHAKNLSHESQVALFSLITAALYNSLYALLIFCIINHQMIFDWCNIHDQASALIVTLFFIILVTDTIALTYEKLFETKAQAGTLSIIYIIGCILALAIGMASEHISPVLTLLLLALVRVSTCALLAGLSLHMWRLAMSYTMQPAVFFATIIVSLAVKLISAR
jgi:hypothetical protein